MTLVGSGTIGPGSAEYYDVTLAAARPHRVYVHPDDPTVDFDLYVYDQNGNPITQDVSTSSDAYCIITPLWTGPFRVVVKSAAGASSYKITVEE